MFSDIDRRLSRVYLLVVLVITAFCLAAGLYYNGGMNGVFTQADVDFSEGWTGDDGFQTKLPGAFQDGRGIIRVEKTLPDGLPNDALMVISSSYLPVIASVDGQMMDVRGTFIDGIFGLTYANSRSVIALNESHASKRMVLEILASGHGSKMIPEVYSIALGSCAAIEANNLKGSRYVNIIGSIMMILAGTLVLLAVFMYRRGAREGIYDIALAAAFITLSAIWFFTDTGDNTVRYGVNGAYLFINLFSFLLIAVPFMMLIRINCSVGRGLMAVMSAMPILLSVVVASALIFGHYCLWVTLTSSHILIIACLVMSISCLWIDLFIRRNTAVRAFFWGAMVIAATGLATMVSFYWFCLPDNTLYFRYGLVLITIVLAVRAISATVGRVIDAHNLEKLRYASSHDALTGIRNGEAFYEDTQKLLDANPRRDFVIASLDVERFSLINDVFGREMGNDLLRFIARILGELVANDGTYGRLESDKFLLCLPVGANDVPGISEKLQSDIKRFALDCNVTLSFGFFIVNGRGLPVAAMADRASIARETIKDNFIKRWAIYDDGLRLAMLHKQNIINTLDSSLAAGDIWMALQPKIKLDTRKIDGAEALARWRHPTQGDLKPSSFIPILEQNGLIIKLDNYIWEMAARALRAWIDEFGLDDAPSISVNVSRVHLFRTNLVVELAEIVKRYDIPPRLFALEITESVYASNPANLTRITDELRAFGFKIHMDDFGSGYSSLNMLKNVKVDVIKLDMGFLLGGGDKKNSVEIIRAVVNMARAMGISVLAEGVETDEQEQMLKQMGCGEAQGFRFGCPASFEDVTAMIRKLL